MDEFAKFLSERGYTAQATFDNDEWTLSICHDSWITPNLYASLALPTWRSPCLELILPFVMQYVEQIPCNAI